MTETAFHVSTSALRQDVLLHPASLPQGVARLEFSGVHAYMDDKELDAALDRLKVRGMRAFLAHNYFPAPQRPFVLNFASRNEEVRANSLALGRRAIALCARHGIPYYSFHPGYLADAKADEAGRFHFERLDQAQYGQALDRYAASIRELDRLARPLGVGLAAENLFCNPDGTRTSINATFSELEDMLSVSPPDIGLLTDLGHLNIAATHLGQDRDDYLDRLLNRYGERVWELHLSGNDGQKDEHLPLRQGNWQLGVLERFRDLPGCRAQGVIATLEARRLSAQELHQSLELMAASWEPALPIS